VSAQAELSDAHNGPQTPCAPDATSQIPRDAASSGSPLQILLVEDSLADRCMIRQLLREYDRNHQLSEVEDGEEALDYLKRHGKFAGAARPDLILLDLNLPRLGGLQVLDELKRDDRFRLIPVIVLTSSQSPKDIEAAYQAGANLYLRKPPDLEGIERLLRDIAQIWFLHAALPSRNSLLAR
jgi:CheY-like chemotaxis protein